MGRITLLIRPALEDSPMSNFRPIDRKTAYLLPPSVDDWLSEDHLARFVVDIVDQLDGLTALLRRKAPPSRRAPQAQSDRLLGDQSQGARRAPRLVRPGALTGCFRRMAQNKRC